MYSRELDWRDEAQPAGSFVWVPQSPRGASVLCCVDQGVPNTGENPTFVVSSALGTEDLLWQLLTSRCLLLSQLLP